MHPIRVDSLNVTLHLKIFLHLQLVCNPNISSVRISVLNHSRNSTPLSYNKRNDTKAESPNEMSNYC